MAETETIEKESAKPRALTWNQEDGSKEDARVVVCAVRTPGTSSSVFPHTAEPVPRVETGSSFHSFSLTFGAFISGD